MKKLPDTPYPHKGEPDAALRELDSLAPPLKSVAEDIAELMERHNLQEATIAIDSNGSTSGTVQLTRAGKGGLKVALRGSLKAGESSRAGTPYLAHYNGEFFWRPTPDSKDFVKNGERVRAGQLVGWAMGESKDISFGIRAEADGVIYLQAPSGSKVKENETVLFYIESNAT